MTRKRVVMDIITNANMVKCIGTFALVPCRVWRGFLVTGDSECESYGMEIQEHLPNFVCLAHALCSKWHWHARQPAAATVSAVSYP